MEANEKRRSAIGWVLTVVIAVAAALLIRSFVFGVTLVDGPSMQPTLYTNERLAVEKVSRYFGLPERGDIVIVHYPNEDDTYVKRVIGLPGEVLEIKDSVVYINGESLDEPYVSSEPYADMEPITVPEEHIFVMGDNRANSWDSRKPETGPIAQGAIIGHAVFVIYPLDMLRHVA